jgi:hypothetical protein
MQLVVNRPPLLHDGKWSPVSAERLSNEISFHATHPSVVHDASISFAKEALVQVESFYRAEIDFARKNGLSAMVDCRVQRFMPDMFGSIPGWHCDFVPRSTITGQPNFSAVNPAAFQVAVTLSAEPQGVSNTEYVDTSLSVKVFDDAHVYRDLHYAVEQLKPFTQQVKDGVFVKFTPKTMHRATCAKRRGWRLFFRYAMVHKPEIKNVINPPQQMYLLSEGNGW